MIVIFDLDDTLYDTSGQLDESFKNIDKIKPFPEAKKLLSAKGFRKILVTRVKHSIEIQNKKIDTLGIRDYFEEIVFCPNEEDKKSRFEEVIKKNKGEKIIVVGNRPDSELRYGKMLGLTTVLLHHGKYKDIKPADRFEIPDYTIKKLDELLNIL